LKTLVNPNNVDEVVKYLKNCERASLDTETTGLDAHYGDRSFSTIIADASDEFYFNYNIGGFRKDEILPKIQDIVNHINYLFFVNFEFDYTMLHFDGVVIDKPKILDCGVMARLENSSHFPKNNFFSLDYLAEYYLKASKDSTVEDYIKEHDLYGIDRHGEKKPLYAKVPLDIMFSYGCSDARLTYDIGNKILQKINARDAAYSESRPKSFKKIMDKLKNESELSPVLAEVKNRGMKVDVDYCEKAIEHEESQKQESLKIIDEVAKININSPKQVQNFIMNDLGLKLPKIIKRGEWTGGYSTEADTLIDLSEKHDNPMLKHIVNAKQAGKKISTYYSNFLKLRDKEDVIHCGLGQETTKTGRLSSFSPNLQNIHKEAYHEWAVRNAFVTRPDFDLYFLDYKGQEMYIMIDLSGDQQVIEKVKDGVDIYVAMAEMVKQHTGIEITRSEAKALSLGVAYGQGAALIASNLGCSLEQAKKLKKVFLASLRGVNALDQWCKTQAKKFGRIHNPYGRVTQIDRGFEYKALNAMIQGTAADCTKTGIVEAYKFLQPYKSNVVLSVHDEIIFEIHHSEKHLVEDLQQIMIDAYPHRHLPLRVDIEVSSSSWAKKQEVTL
jgi:DNA polymerase-1